ncbi:MAG: flagellar export chaperone FliS [Candidatus Melainabacteria bacterium HGW-Melainabacteria-1]|nr:MAG: flagellar export chaperone FliS [Candidatus Melainabacteria bacterium HGW-Melainabacteria-1]
MTEAIAGKSQIRLSPVAKTQAESVQSVDSYKLAHIETATPERLLVMLYDGAIKYLNLALQTLASQDIEGTHRNLLKAEAIVLELMTVLDREVGGELANNLYNLYDYMYHQLVQANIHHKPELVSEVIGLLEPLRSAWNEAADTVAQLRAEGKFQLATPGERSFAG